MEELIQLLIKENKTISVMESCTGGGICNAITNISDSSKVFSYGVVTYSNDAKIKIGVSKGLVDKYSVYSSEVACDMARVINEISLSNYSIGVTGKLMKKDENNMFGEDNLVYFCIYDHDNNIFYNESMHVSYRERVDNKNEVINKIVEKMLEIVK